MDRRKFLLGAGGAAVGGSALLGSGAFTRVESQRAVTIEVAEDPNAYLGMQGCPDSPNQSYTNIDDQGHLEVDMSQSNPTDADGQGINSDSYSYFDDVFQICNNGKQAACIYIEDSDSWPTYDPEGEDPQRRVEFYTGSSMGATNLNDLADQSVIGEGNSTLLPVGECLCVGIATVSKDLSNGDLLLDALDNEVTIVADADAECNSDVACADLAARYNCTVEGDGEDTATRIDVNNPGTDATDYGWAVLGEPNVYRDGVRNVPALGGDTFTTDASAPEDGIVWYEGDPDCAEEFGLQTYAEFRDARGTDDPLITYIENETAGIPDGAYVAEIGGFPVTDENRVICEN